jgi:hypothetical protein
MRPGRDSDHSSPSSAEVKKKRGFSPPQAPFMAYIGSSVCERVFYGELLLAPAKFQDEEIPTLIAEDVVGCTKFTVLRN